VGRHSALLTAILLATAALPRAASAEAKAPAGVTPAASLSNYFDLLDGGDVEAAVALCHADDDGESHLALSTLGYGQRMCVRAIEQRFGEDGVRQTVGRPLGAKEAAASKVAINGATARLTLAGGASFPFVRVGGEWKLSMRELAGDYKLTPDQLARGFREMAQTYLLTAREVVDGKHKKPSDVNAALEKRGHRRATSASDRRRD